MAEGCNCLRCFGFSAFNTQAMAVTRWCVKACYGTWSVHVIYLSVIWNQKKWRVFPFIESHNFLSRVYVSSFEKAQGRLFASRVCVIGVYIPKAFFPQRTFFLSDAKSRPNRAKTRNFHAKFPLIKDFSQPLWRSQPTGWEPLIHTKASLFAIATYLIDAEIDIKCWFLQILSGNYVFIWALHAVLKAMYHNLIQFLWSLARRWGDRESLRRSGEFCGLSLVPVVSSPKVLGENLRRTY